jgi:hypothetical protein
MVTKKQVVEKIKNLLEQGTALSGKHDAYVETYVEKGNEKLGILLSEVMAYAVEVLAMPNLEHVIKKMRRTLSREYKIKTQNNSPDLNIIVRYVIRKNRKTAHVYARVLQVAIDAGVNPVDLPAFIKANEGIERIRQSTVNPDIVKAKEDKQQYLNDNAIMFARFYFEDRAKKPLATFIIPKEHESAMRDLTRFGSFQYTISHIVDGEYKVVGALPMYEQLDDQLMIQSFNYLHAQGLYRDEEKASMAVAKQQVIEWRQRLAKRDALREKERNEREQAAELKKLASQEAANDAGSDIDKAA